MVPREGNITQYHLHKAHPEKLQFEVYNLADYRKESGQKAAVPHSHSYYQIIWFFEDGGSHAVDFKNYDIKKNTILFVNKDQIHAFDDDLEVQGWLIHFNESFFMHTDVDIFLKYNLFSNIDRPYYVIDDETALTAASYVELMRKELLQKLAFGYKEVIRFLLKSFLIHLERLHQDGANKKLQFTNASERQFFNFKELVEMHYREHWTVAEYSNKLNVSSKTLTTLTKKNISKSPSKMIKERLILQAKRLLLFTTLSVGEVAFRIGFDDDSYFVRYFKREVGVSPLRFRENK